MKVGKLEVMVKGLERRTDEKLTQILAEVRSVASAQRRTEDAQLETGAQFAEMGRNFQELTRRMSLYESDTGRHGAVPQHISQPRTEPIDIRDLRDHGERDVMRGLERRRVGSLITITTGIATAIVTAVLAAWALITGASK